MGQIRGENIFMGFIAYFCTNISTNNGFSFQIGYIPERKQFLGKFTAIFCIFFSKKFAHAVQFSFDIEIWGHSLPPPRKKNETTWLPSTWPRTFYNGHRSNSEYNIQEYIYSERASIRTYAGTGHPCIRYVFQNIRFALGIYRYIYIYISQIRK